LGSGFSLADRRLDDVVSAPAFIIHVATEDDEVPLNAGSIGLSYGMAVNKLRVKSNPPFSRVYFGFHLIIPPHRPQVVLEAHRGREWSAGRIAEHKAGDALS